MKIIRQLKMLGVTSLAGVVLAACGASGSSASSSSSSGSSGKSYTFELITKSNASPYWLAVKEGADAAAKKYGVKVNFEAPASGTDLQSQISMVQNATTAHVSGIILAAQNPSALLGPVKAAQAQGIPVVTVDSGISPNISKSFLATSNVSSSAQLAKYVAKKAGGSGQYAIVDFNQEASTGVLRPKGFKQGMASFPGFKFVGMQLSNNSIPTARSEATAFLVSHPNIKVIFGANDRSAIGVAEAVQAQHLVGKVIVAGFDADPGEVNLIKSGAISASVLQSPYQMGYQAVQELKSIKAGKSVPKRVDTPYKIVTQKNIGSPSSIKAIQQYIPNYKG